jgi:hypothetical protein
MRDESSRVRNLTAWLPSARRVKRALAPILVITVSLQAVSCGTLMHPNRVGQPRTGPIDPTVVVLDGLGVLLFVIPGLAAFVVDFATGAIYMPGPAYYPVPAGAYPPPGYAPPGAYPPPGVYPGPPPTAAGYPPPPPSAPVPMTRIDVDPTLLTKAKIQAVVRAQTGRDVDLDGPDVRVQRVQSVDEASRLLIDTPAH